MAVADDVVPEVVGDGAKSVVGAARELRANQEKGSGGSDRQGNVDADLVADVCVDVVAEISPPDL